MKNKKQLEYRGILCDSQEEINFLYWAFELLDGGVIKAVERSPSFKLSEPLKEKYNVTKQLKTKTVTKVVEKTILREHVYTPEFVLYSDTLLKHQAYERETHHKLYDVFREALVSNTDSKIGQLGDLQEAFYVEIKASFIAHNMERLFKVNQKWMFDKHKIFINLVKPNELFEQTFLPKMMLKTPTGKPRTINFKYKLFEEWIKTM